MVDTVLDTLSQTSKIWIYQSNKSFSDSENALIENKLNEFLEQWNSHGDELTGDFAIIENKFILVAVDETKASASGCSIDSSVHTIKQIGEAIGVDLLDKSTVYYNDNGEIKGASFLEIKNLVESGTISSETLIYDVSITKLADYTSKWPKKASNTWVSRYFK